MKLQLSSFFEYMLIFIISIGIVAIILKILSIIQNPILLHMVSFVFVMCSVVTILLGIFIEMHVKYYCSNCEYKQYCKLPEQSLFKYKQIAMQRYICELPSSIKNAICITPEERQTRNASQIININKPKQLKASSRYIKILKLSRNSCPYCREQRLTRDIHHGRLTHVCGFSITKHMLYNGNAVIITTPCQGEYFQEHIQESIWEGV